MTSVTIITDRVRPESGKSAALPGEGGGAYLGLSSYRRCVEHIRANWPAFAANRRERLQQGLFDAPVEKIAESILEDLLVDVLDWPLADVNLQIGCHPAATAYADAHLALEQLGRLPDVGCCGGEREPSADGSQPAAAT